MLVKHWIHSQTWESIARVTAICVGLGPVLAKNQVIMADEILMIVAKQLSLFSEIFLCCIFYKCSRIQKVCAPCRLQPQGHWRLCPTLSLSSCSILLFSFTHWNYQQFCNLLPVIHVLPLALLHFEKIVHYFSNSHSPVWCQLVNQVGRT